MRSKYRVCSHPSCATLVSRENPCPQHGRPVNASWSKDRDHRAHARNRREVLKRTTVCEHCGKLPTRYDPLVVHHVRPGNTPQDVLVVLKSCHKKLDTHAR